MRQSPRQADRGVALRAALNAVLTVLGLFHFGVCAIRAQNPIQEGAGKQKDAVGETAIRALISQLGDDSFARRDEATKRLSAIGAPALPILFDTVKKSTDAEIRERSQALIIEINAKVPPLVVPVKALVSEIAFSPDSATMAAACGDKVIRIYESKSGRLRQTLSGHDARVWCVVFSPNGKKLASCSGDYNAPNEPGQIKIWDLATGKEERTFLGHKGIALRVAYSPDGATLYSASWDGTIRVWDIQRSKEQAVLQGHQGAAVRICFTPDGKTLISAGFDGTMRYWNRATNTEERRIQAHPEGIGALALSPDGKIVVTGSRVNSPRNPGVIKLWDRASGQEKETSMSPTRKVVSMVVSPDGAYVAMGGGLGAPIGEVKLFALASGNELAVFALKQWVECVAISPNGKWLAAGGGDPDPRGAGVLRLWELPRLTGK
jgi:WD40 repeat protein